MVSSIKGKESLLSQLTAKSRDLGSTFSKLSSGLRLNKASDGPAELSVAISLLATADLGNRARENISYGASAINIADSTMSQIAGITDRMGELAAKSANGTLSDNERVSLANEFNALKEEINRISETAEFNGIKLLKGSEITIQSGVDGSEDSRLSLAMPDVTSASLGFDSMDISTAAGARNALDGIKNAAGELTKTRSTLGAGMARLETANANLQVSSENAIAAASAIRDANIAEESARLVSNLILQQVNVSTLNQYKLSSANVLNLLNN